MAKKTKQKPKFSIIILLSCIMIFASAGVYGVYKSQAAAYDITQGCASLDFVAVTSRNRTYAKAVANSKNYPTCVKQIQHSLNYICKASDISVNGYFDSKTKYRVAQFQRDAKLVTDGIVGSITWNNLSKHRYRSTGPNSLSCTSSVNYPSYSY